MARRDQVSLDTLRRGATQARAKRLTRDANLIVELCEASRVALQLTGKEFQRDRLPEPEIIGSINLTHSPAAEKTDDSIPLAENGAGREAAMIDRVG